LRDLRAFFVFFSGDGADAPDEGPFFHSDFRLLAAFIASLKEA